MKRILLAGATLLALTAAQPTLAADAPVYKGPAPYAAAALFNWTGLYVGANVGYGWGESTDTATPLPTPAAFGANPFSQKVSPQGVFGGAQIGYNMQTGNFVWGIETDIQASGIRQSTTLNGLPNSAGVIIPAWNNVNTQRIDWFGTVRLRAGIAADRTLIYLTGGLIYGSISTSSLTTYTPLPPFTYSGAATNTRAGFTVGGGIEYAFSNNWTMKLEGLYFSFPGQNYLANPLAPNPPFQVGHSFSRLSGVLARLGMNVKF